VIKVNINKQLLLYFFVNFKNLYKRYLSCTEKGDEQKISYAHVTDRLLKLFTNYSI